MSGLYIHIPYCERKCDYCAFYSISKPWKNEREFFQCLELDIEKAQARYPEFSPTTLFIGGGTPTATSFQCLETFLPTLGKFSPTEFSVEVNPGTVDEAQLSLLQKNGVNRLSIGVQSFDIQCLETLGRIHSAEEAEDAFRKARAVGFTNISLDLMFGVPGQTLEMLEADIERALQLDPEHISVYNLMYEEGTPIAARLDRLDEELEREMYDVLRNRLTGTGFEHYEISNFAKPGHECQHNLLYWTGGDYIGCGPSAHSHMHGTRWATVADLERYLAFYRTKPIPSVGPHEFEETLNAEAKDRETLVMGLRLLRGVKISSKVWNNHATVFQTLEKEGLLVIEGHHIRLSDEALFVSNAVFSELV